MRGLRGKQRLVYVEAGGDGRFPPEQYGGGGAKEQLADEGYFDAGGP